MITQIGIFLARFDRKVPIRPLASTKNHFWDLRTPRHHLARKLLEGEPPVKEEKVDGLNTNLQSQFVLVPFKIEINQ